MAQMSARSSVLLIAGAIILLGIGGSIYVTQRPPHWASGITALGLSYSYPLSVSPGIRVITDLLPSFLHVAAFTCLSYACCEDLSRKRALVIALGWTAINVLFEIGQAVKPSLPIASVTAYFEHGTFDWLDVLASICGGLATFLLVERFSKWREGNSHE